MKRENIRNFSIIAHIDHGKSTIADRILELTNAVEKRDMKSQLLDSMELERERGITIKLNAVSLNYNYKGEDYLLNLIDTPGHVDFTYEVSRSLAACEGAILVVDATQGIEAQTFANLYLAMDNDLTIIPIINKIDLPNAEVDRVKKEIIDTLGFNEDDIILCSAKEGIGIKELVEKVGLFRKEFDGAQDFDLFLRVTEQTTNIVHIPKVLYHWRTHNLSTSQNMETKMYAIEAGKKAIEEHCKRLNMKANVYEEKPLGLYRVKYELEEKPLVSIIIPNKDSIKYLKTAINSVLKSTYTNYEILILENNSKNSKTFKYYDIIQKNPKIKVIKYTEKGFNYSKINNFAVKQTKGKYIVLLNNDIKVITPDWLEEMLGICQRNEVGIVGAKLLYYDKTIQHAGVVIGMGGIAGHVNRTISEKEPGYFGRTKIINDFSAVTAACLMTKKELYEKVEGLDEKFAVAFNDVDFCMKIRKLNKLVVYTPYAKLYHYESKTRGYEDTPEKKKRFENEIQLFKEKWGKELKEGDPYFNKNLDLYSEQCEIKDN